MRLKNNQIKSLANSSSQRFLMGCAPGVLQEMFNFSKFIIVEAASVCWGRGCVFVVLGLEHKTLHAVCVTELSHLTCSCVFKYQRRPLE